MQYIDNLQILLFIVYSLCVLFVSTEPHLNQRMLNWASLFKY